MGVRMLKSRLEMDRLILRMLDESDFSGYAAMCSDAEVMRYIGEGQVLSRDEAWRNLALMLGHWQLRGYGQWAVEERESGKFIGRVGFWNPEGWPGLELGWMLRREFWGQGFATEAARALLPFAFLDLKQTRIISLIRPGNQASVRVADRLGEKLVGKVNLKGMEAMVYEIRHQDWNDA
jgi:RimJ/RimL family protein N-acetyltransferase